jgi:peroxiredoxin
MPVSSILKNFDSYYNYEYKYVKLSEDYAAYDVTGRPVNKNRFLQSIASGRYLPVRLSSPTAIAVYKLYRLPLKIKADISGRLQQLGEQYHEFYAMEGRPLPDFDFTDINGHQYNRSTTNGKIIVLKCWFINCHTCVQEMPQVNALANRYKNRKDVLFLSLASDTKPKLEAFLRKTTFKYAVVANQNSYMLNQLKVHAFPTHFIINRQGKIAKVLDSADELWTALPEQISK